MILKREFQRTLDRLGAAGIQEGRLFEVGCAYGFFLTEASKSFQVSGAEPCPEAVAYCRTQGLDVELGLVTEEMLAARAPLDVIVMLDVIEHLLDPLDVLRSAYRQLRPGGQILLTTGDWNSVLARMTGSRWRLMTPPQHVFFFSPENIRRMLRRAGFFVTNLEHPAKHVPASLLLFQLARIFGFRQRTFSTLSSLSVPINLRDAMRVIAVRE